MTVLLRLQPGGHPIRYIHETMQRVERVMDLKTERTAKKKAPKTPEDKLDDALEDTFPASDPPAQTEPITHLGAKHKSKKR